jgi:hypothetical protein
MAHFCSDEKWAKPNSIEECFDIWISGRQLYVRGTRPFCHPDLAAIINRCIHDDARMRYQTAGELANDLAQLLETTAATLGSNSHPGFDKAAFPERRGSA